MEETREITMKELAAIFKAKYVNVSSTDRYGITIELHKCTIEFEDDLQPELWFVVRDNKNNVIGSVCIDEESIENIEQYGDTYTINFTHNITSVDVSEYETV